LSQIALGARLYEGAAGVQAHAIDVLAGGHVVKCIDNQLETSEERGVEAVLLDVATDAKCISLANMATQHAATHAW
jgi:hypothetical protein